MLFRFLTIFEMQFQSRAVFAAGFEFRLQFSYEKFEAADFVMGCDGEDASKGAGWRDGNAVTEASGRNASTGAGAGNGFDRNKLLSASEDGRWTETGEKGIESRAAVGAPNFGESSPLTRVIKS
jgi:hypothetical protein